MTRALPDLAEPNPRQRRGSREATVCGMRNRAAQRSSLTHASVLLFRLRNDVCQPATLWYCTDGSCNASHELRIHIRHVNGEGVKTPVLR